MLQKLLRKITGAREKSLGVGEPNSAEESIAVKKALKEKYPQMSEAGWGVAKSIKKARKKSSPSVKEHQTLSQKSLEGALSERELARYMKRKATREGTRKKAK